MEIVRREPAGPDDFRARQLRARDMLRGDLDGADLEKYVQESILTTTLDKAVAWARRLPADYLQLRAPLRQT